MPVLGRRNDSRLPEFLRNRKSVKDFKPGDLVDDVEVIGWPDDQYGHPAGGGLRLVQYRIIELVKANGGSTGTLWTFKVEDTATGVVSEQQFTELFWYRVTR